MRLPKKLLKELAKDEGASLIDPETWRLDVLPTGIDALDVASGVGGLPQGRFIILHGKEQSGKTTVAFHCLAAAQFYGGVAVYFDYEHKLDLRYMTRVGVKQENLILAKPRSIEKGFETLDKIGERIRQDSRDCPIVVVWDSLHAGMAEATVKVGWSTKGYPPEARVYAHCLRRFAGGGDDLKITLIGVSQVRSKIGEGMPQFGMWGDREKIAVGNAANFYATQIIRFKHRRRPGKPPADDVEAVFFKNQVAPKYGLARLVNVYGLGIDFTAATYEALRSLGMLTNADKRGWWTLEVGGESHKAQGAPSYAQLAEKFPEFHAAVREEIARRIAPGAGETKVVEKDDDDEEEGKPGVAAAEQSPEADPEPEAGDGDQ